MARRTRVEPKPTRKPSVLESNPQARQHFLTAVSAGLPYSRAALAAGIDERLVRRWMARGRLSIDAADAAEETGEPFEPDEPYHSFTVEVLTADASGETRLLSRIHKASEREWRAAAWMLERRYRDRYAPPAATVELAGNPDRPVFTPAEQHPIDPATAAAEVIAALTSAGLLDASLADTVRDDPEAYTTT